MYKCVFLERVSLCFIIHTLGCLNVMQSLKKHKKTKHCDNFFPNLAMSLTTGTVYHSLKKWITCKSGTKVSRTYLESFQTSKMEPFAERVKAVERLCSSKRQALWHLKICKKLIIVDKIMYTFFFLISNSIFEVYVRVAWQIYFFKVKKSC